MKVLVFIMIVHWNVAGGRSIDLERVPSLEICEQLVKQMKSLNKTRVAGRGGFRADCLVVEE